MNKRQWPRDTEASRRERQRKNFRGRKKKKKKKGSGVTDICGSKWSLTQKTAHTVFVHFTIM